MSASFLNFFYITWSLALPCRLDQTWYHVDKSLPRKSGNCLMLRTIEHENMVSESASEPCWKTLQDRGSLMQRILTQELPHLKRIKILSAYSRSVTCWRNLNEAVMYPLLESWTPQADPRLEIGLKGWTKRSNASTETEAETGSFQLVSWRKVEFILWSRMKWNQVDHLQCYSMWFYVIPKMSRYVKWFLISSIIHIISHQNLHPSTHHLPGIYPSPPGVHLHIHHVASHARLVVQLLPPPSRQQSLCAPWSRHQNNIPTSWWCKAPNHNPLLQML